MSRFPACVGLNRVQRCHHSTRDSMSYPLLFWLKITCPCPTKLYFPWICPLGIRNLPPVSCSVRVSFRVAPLSPSSLSQAISPCIFLHCGLVRKGLSAFLHRVFVLKVKWFCRKTLGPVTMTVGTEANLVLNPCRTRRNLDSQCPLRLLPRVCRNCRNRQPQPVPGLRLPQYHFSHFQYRESHDTLALLLLAS